MNRQMFQWISQLVRDKPNQASSRPLSQMGQQVRTHYGCGYIGNNRLIFSAEDKRHLRRQVLAEVGRDPFTIEQLPSDRLEMAQYHPDEKLAAKPAGGDQLLLNSVDGIIRLNGEQIQLHPKSIRSAGLLCLNSSIETIQHQTIVVVENLAIMPLCHGWQMPCLDRQALWVYRGDHRSGAKAQACRDFVDRFGVDKTVIVFSDMDPKGLEIALTMPHVNYWLGPEQVAWSTCLQSPLANREGFNLQSAALAYLERLSEQEKLAEALNKLLISIKQERASFRQEHMFSRQVGLELFPLSFRP
ncbi:hypothetical protein IVG45_02820 [Methylomonas sp. LL1]|uniref:DUF7281 domain-containing protein n=1 Tax=Methylomonas sp. LL1 TaxID=2785785 RepID=UPI0018C3F9A5|nr:hypothetical protein [Methylomonas sp. LL1]QPK63928.1 hypothetical protein IVG45_02820 [Methylomonas sp. LL1]